MSPIAQERALISGYEFHRHSVPLIANRNAQVMLSEGKNQKKLPDLVFKTLTQKEMSVLNAAECSYMGFDSSFKRNAYAFHDLKLQFCFLPYTRQTPSCLPALFDPWLLNTEFSLFAGNNCWCRWMKFPE